MLETVVLIPSLNPNEKLVWLVRGLKEAGFEKIIVVDDGSSKEYMDIFKQAEALGCILIHHGKNLGKGAAIKTALAAAIEKYGCRMGCITADSDGQHLPKDIRRVAEMMISNPNALVMGVRDFNSDNVPMRSLAGNRFTSAFFKVATGITCSDTQTGLRGIPVNLLETALSVEGERYEFEMNFLMDAVHRTTLIYVPIETVYEDNNQISHFRPIVDSCRVYGRFLRFAIASLSGSLVDCVLFYILTLLLHFSQTKMIFAATVLSRIVSGIVNFLLNRHWSFRSRMPAGRELIRYFTLFFCQMFASAAMVSVFSLFSVPIIAVKVIVDTFLFFISFRIQNKWVFRQEDTIK